LRKRWLSLIALCIAALSVQADVSRAQQPPATDAPRYVVVQYDRPHGRAIRAFGQRAPTLQESGFEQLEVPDGMTADEFVAQLEQDPEVIAAEAPPSRAVTAAFVPNDTYYNSAGANQAAYLNQIGAAGAWDLTTGDDEIVVAVLDSGLDLGHEEFAGRLWENAADADGDGVDDDNNGCIDDRYGCRFVNLDDRNGPACGYTDSSTGNQAWGDVRDDHHAGSQFHSHGTMVAGILGASGNNQVGVAGMAWGVKIMPIKVLDCGRASGGLPEGDDFNLAEGINYAVRMGADVINLSLASPNDTFMTRQAVADAQAAGVIIVAAAGNASGSSVGVFYPAAYAEFPNVIAVGSTNNQVSATTWWPKSRYGPPVDFAAPGSHVLTSARSDLGFAIPYFSTNDGGTSFATPFVAGTFALMMSRNPVLTPAEYIQIARDSATPAAAAPHGQNWAGSGVINAGAAVARVPMRITGEALHDWEYLPPASQVRAIIDGQECGTTTTSTNTGQISRYDIRVKSAAEQPGCGAPGKTVQIQVAGAPATPTLTWGERNQSLYLQDRSVSSVTPPPGSVVVQALNGGWSNIAVLDPSGELPDVLSSLSGWSTIYRWDPTEEGFLGLGAYERYSTEVPDFVNNISSLATFEAVWVDGPAGNVATLNPNPPSSRSIGLQPGWNNFVYTGTNREVKDALSGIAGKYTLVLQYNNPTREWQIHTPGGERYNNDFGGLFKLQAYWVYVTEPAVLTMN
jgi:subtilisin family serine protease